MTWMSIPYDSETDDSDDVLGYDSETDDSDADLIHPVLLPEPRSIWSIHVCVCVHVCACVCANVHVGVCCFMFMYSNATDRSKIENNDCSNLVQSYDQGLFSKIGTYVIIALAAFNLLKEVAVCSECVPDNCTNLYTAFFVNPLLGATCRAGLV